MYEKFQITSIEILNGINNSNRDINLLKTNKTYSSLNTNKLSKLNYNYNTYNNINTKFSIKKVCIEDLKAYLKNICYINNNKINRPKNLIKGAKISIKINKRLNCKYKIASKKNLFSLNNNKNYYKKIYTLAKINKYKNIIKLNKINFSKNFSLIKSNIN